MYKLLFQLFLFAKRTFPLTDQGWTETSAKPVLVATSIKRPPVFKSPYSVIPKVHSNSNSGSKFTSIKQLAPFKGHFTVPLEWVLKTGFPAYSFARRIFSSQARCKKYFHPVHPDLAQWNCPALNPELSNVIFRGKCYVEQDL